MQLLVISAKTVAENQFEGDIVGVFPDDHVFSDHEKDIFTIVEGVDQKAIDMREPAGGGQAVLPDDHVSRYAMRWEDGVIKENAVV